MGYAIMGLWFAVMTFFTEGENLPEILAICSVTSVVGGVIRFLSSFFLLRSVKSVSSLYFFYTVIKKRWMSQEINYYWLQLRFYSKHGNDTWDCIIAGQQNNCKNMVRRILWTGDWGDGNNFGCFSEEPAVF